MALSPQNKIKLSQFAGRSLAKVINGVVDRCELVLDPVDMRERFYPLDPLIFTMWHGQFMMQPALHVGKVKVAAMVAKHGDAEVIGAALEKFNISLIRGAGAGGRSKDRGGMQALRLSLKALADGTTLAITADVPPGPARRAGDGIIMLARYSGRPIVPVACATTHYVALRTWSRMTINLPYGKLVYCLGEPIYVPKDATMAEIEDYRLKVEAALNVQTKRAYELAGADPRRATPPSARADLVEPGLRLKSYRAATSALRTIAPAILARREAQGKEDPERRPERFGIPSTPRPLGPLVWVHAASVGETNAALPLISKLIERRPDLHFVLTTGTLTSANLAAARLPKQAVHQYVPLDAEQYAQRFLDHWRPDLALFAESEIWPNLLLETHARGIPSVLFNARMSPKSFKRWTKRHNAANAIFGRFTKVLAQNESLARRFRAIGARDVTSAGNIKIDAPPPPIDEQTLQTLKTALKGRPVFLAASTHAGEEKMIAEAHRTMASACQGLCTIIAPRHPARGPSIAEDLQALGFTVSLRSTGALPTAETDIYIADTIGELGTLYALAPLSFIGGSLVPHGGQNPIEAVHHGSAVLMGPHWQNFTDVYGTLIRLKGALEVKTSAQLATNAVALFKDRQSLDKQHIAAKTALATLSGALDKTVAAVLPLIDAAKVQEPREGDASAA
jgi:3-deoxy-D-manno-octulosonic-acid transferase